MKCLADMGISPQTVAFLHALGHDAVHLAEQGLERLLDPGIVEKARQEGRIVLVHDLGCGGNDVMKILAVATIILSIPTVMASIYGMNVPLPGQESVWAFGSIIGLSLMVVLSVGVIFWKRDWL